MKKKKKTLGRKAMKSVKGGAEKPVARYHLENAWPSKQEPPLELKGN